MGAEGWLRKAKTRGDRGLKVLRLCILYYAMEKMEGAAKKLWAVQKIRGGRPPRRRTAPGVMLYQLNQIQQCIFFSCLGGGDCPDRPPRKSATGSRGLSPRP